ncbi:MAG: NADP-dependent oxidoreductase [Solirubrobacteraceae bacterium]
MHVAEVTAFGGPEVLRLAERPDPAPAPSELVVRIRAANVNPTDLGVRSGQARQRLPELEPPFVPGWDLAGEVTAVGSEATGFAPGDRVLGMIPFGRIGGRVGAYAQAAAVETGWLAPLSTDIADTTAATLPLNALTARQALDIIAAPPGATLLVTGASGAVGGFATQLAVRAGLRVLAQASHGDEDWVGSLGATEVLPRDTDLATIGPVEAVLDAVPLGAGSTAALREGGIAVFTRPPRPPEPARDIRFETVLVQSNAEQLRALTADLEAGRLRTRIAEVLPLAEAARAHALNEAGGLRGKVLLAP